MSNKTRGNYLEEKTVSLIRKELNIQDKRKVHRNISSGVAKFEFCDICTPYNWLIECKYRKDIRYQRLIKNWNDFTKDFFKQIDIEYQRFVKECKVVPLITLVVGAPYSDPIATLKKDNFYNNDFINVDQTIDNIFDKYVLYKDGTIIVTFEDLLKYIKQKIREEDK